MMAKPWRKRWPYVARSGARSYAVGFYDHEGVERARSFPTAKAAREWMDDYITAERRGLDSLRRFLLDLDAREANAATEDRTLGEVVQLYFAFNAPDTADGLATSTFRTYSWSANCHLLGHEGMVKGKKVRPAKYAVRLASEPADLFNHATAPRALREGMKREQVGQSARAHAWRVLSAVLSWAAQSDLVPEIQTNGCLLANEKVGNKRKSVRRHSGHRAVRRRGEEIRSWALSPMAVELIRADMLERAVRARRPLMAYRDATVVSIQFGLGMRNQEVFGIRWSSLEGERARVVGVLSWNELDELGKTEHATGRSPRVPALLREDLAWWRARLREYGRPTRGVDFVIPGDLAAEAFGIRDPQTGACHMTGNQAQKWGPRYMTPAVNSVVDNQDGYANLRGATPYALRRGGISTRLRSEDAQSVAEQCGTSLEMLSQHYSYEIDDFSHLGPRSVDDQWRKARAAARALLAERAGRRRLEAAA
jgi:integrase